MKRFATITVLGRDKTGVIASVTSFLFEQGANIEGLEEQVTRGQFSMTLQASWDLRDFDQNAAGKGLTALGHKIGMEIKYRFTDPSRQQRLAIFVTKETHCLDAIMATFRKGQLKKATPVVVISNRKDLAPLAKEYGIPFEIVPWNDRAKAEKKVLKIIDHYEADFITLARFMKILSPNFVWRFKNKIINIHPSLLPCFPGAQAYRQAYEHGVKIAGVTAHFVSMQLDEGPIIAQESFNVKPGMTLKEIVSEGQKRESKALLRALKLYLDKKLDVYWGTVREV
ncbi:formyltetrahydrofolate deformylase [bacterium]|nr:formyltetrahydrofolate deformylase [bacterium]